MPKNNYKGESLRPCNFLCFSVVLVLTALAGDGHFAYLLGDAGNASALGTQKVAILFALL